MADRNALHETAKTMVSKGILAADESDGTIKKRFDDIGVESTKDSRRAWRECLFTTPWLCRHVSGVIMFDETLRAETKNGTPFPKLVADKGMVPIIKVDKGSKPLAGFPGNQVTEGLDGLRERLKEYHELGARGAKWRAVIPVGANYYGGVCANAHALARYAALCQEAGLVPIVEPEVLADGEHSLADCARTSRYALTAVFKELKNAKVDLEGIVLKPSFVTPGLQNDDYLSMYLAAEETFSIFKDCVPTDVPGIAFLSGGHSEAISAELLHTVNLVGNDAPWRLTFSFGRALQEGALIRWGGLKKNKPFAQSALHDRARLAYMASKGRYNHEHEQAFRTKLA